MDPLGSVFRRALSAINSERNLGSKLRYNSKILKVKNKLEYGSSLPDAHNLIWIDPDDIKYILVPALRKDLGRRGTYILSGKWDKSKIVDMDNPLRCLEAGVSRCRIKYDNYIFHKSMIQHFKYESHWKETAWYQYYLEILENKPSKTGLQCKKDLYSHLRGIDDLYMSIKRDGYKKQSDLNPKAASPELDEVLIDIGRNGCLLFEDGRHRLSIAKILNLEKIPVRVLVRHEDWQELRTKISKNNTAHNPKQAMANHPDTIDN